MSRVIVRNRALGVLYDYLKTVDASGTFLLPASTCETVLFLYFYLGLDYFLVDLDDATMSMDLKAAENIIQTYDISGIHYVYNYGFADSEKKISSHLKELKNKYNIIVIEDKCLCMPELSLEKVYSDLVIYSTGYAKYMDLGYGGYGFANNLQSIGHWQIGFSESDLTVINRKVRMASSNTEPFDFSVLKNLKWLDNTIIEEDLYFKSIKKRLTEIYEHKMRLNQIYKKYIPVENQCGDEFNHWRFLVKLNDTSGYEVRQIQNRLAERKLFSSNHYRPLNYLLNRRDIAYSHADRLWNSTIQLFNDQYYNEKMAYETGEVLSSYFKGEYLNVYAGDGENI